MRISYNWLRDYVDVDLVPSKLAERLTMAGLEVEEIHDRFEYLDNVKVARVAEVEDHPNSDHLKVCRVKTGDDVFQVICGAPNVQPGMFSAMALAGTELPSGNVVGEAEIRGVRSTGMLCSEAELIVGLDASGIMNLAGEGRVGQSLKSFLEFEDWIFEIGITPNRPDCLSMLGVAREVAGLTGAKINYPEIHVVEGPERIDDLTSIEVLDPDHCPRYAARLITGVKIGPSPFWLVDRLISGGVRAINNIVDITNFVLLEMGQPQHAFDMDFLEEHRIVVKTADEGDRFVTLDKVERIMGPEMLMICDGKKPVGLAGVMGGLNSEIVPETSNVLLESAYFSPVSIRRTSKTLGLSTEASFRFERGCDPEICVYAADRAAALMHELAGGTVAAGVIDVRDETRPKRIIPFSPAKCNRFLGTDFEADDMKRSLSAIELKVTGDGEALNIEAPSFRVDLTREVDIFEEVARLLGFDNVPPTLPAARAEIQPMTASWRLRTEVREILVGLGLSEIITYSFIAEDFCDRLQLPKEDFRRRTVRIINPLSEEQVLMRTTLAPGLFEVLRHNRSFNVLDVGIFEIGLVFFPVEGEELPEERLMLGGLLAGARAERSWHEQPVQVDFYDIKGAIEDLLAGLGLTDPVFRRGDCPAYYDVSTSAEVLIEDRPLGWVGCVSGSVARAFDIKERQLAFEIDLQSLLEIRPGIPQFKALPRYPFVDRDLSVILDRRISSAEVIGFIRELGENFLVDIFVFDAYEGERIEKGKRSLAFRLRYQSWERTLTDDEVNAIHKRVMNRVLSEFKAALQA